MTSKAAGMFDLQDPKRVRSAQGISDTSQNSVMWLDDVP